MPGKRQQEVLQDRPVVDEALAEVALEQPPDVVEVLLPEGLVEAQRLADLQDEGGRRVLAEDGDGGIAGQQLDEHEQDDRQADQDRDGPEQPAHDELQHGLAQGS